MTHPLTLLLAIAIPQSILLLLNLRTYHLLSDEVDADQKNLIFAFFAGELVLLVGGCILAGWLWKRRVAVPWAWNWAIFVPTLTWLAFFLVKLDGLIPRDLQAWIVVPETQMFYQFVFLMPAVFVSMLGLACFPVRKGAGADVGISIAAAVGVPLGWYLLLQVFSGAFLDRLPAFLITISVAFSSLVSLGAVLRILTMLFTWAMGKGRVSQSILIALVAIVAPIGGLLLNRSIPFPANFQIWPVYIIAIVNGLLLVFPKTGQKTADQVIWLAQCTLFPFTLYFFLVFLPYLPLAAIAMILAGAGFLILSPSALFLIHLRRIVQQIPSVRWIPAGVVAALLLPTYIATEMMVDRVVLHRAIDYVYSPSPESEGRFDGSRSALRRSLLRLQGVKEGVYLPFLTEWYNEAVLDGLVLNDEKLGFLYFTFFGESIPAPENARGSGFGMRFGSSARFGTAPPPPKAAILERLSHTVTTDPENGTRTLVKLELHNPSRAQAEYHVGISLPEGTVVSGYWLHIGEERVPGILFEKKTAMWVYRMIRDSRRDPGLVTYREPGRLDLRVFPLAGDERRITEIEFLSPPGQAPQIEIGEEVIPGESEARAQVVPWGETGQTVFLPAQPGEDLPLTEREPCFHFLVDRSAKGLEAEEAARAIGRISERFPEVTQAVVAAANYEFIDAESDPVPVADLDAEVLGSLLEKLPLRGGFLAEAGLERGFVDTIARSSVSADAAPGTFPVFVLVKGARTVVPSPKGLDWWGEAIPEADRYFLVDPDSDRIQARDLHGEKAKVEVPDVPVILLCSGSEVQAVPAGSGAVTADFRSRDPVRVFDPEGSVFLDLEVEPGLDSDSDYALAREIHALDETLRRSPSLGAELLPEVVRRSRETGILVPSTAYIVVENSAQWKMLKQKEKEKLDANQALDFMEAPAPAIGWIVLFFALVLGLRRSIRRRSRAGAPAS